MSENFPFEEVAEKPRRRVDSTIWVAFGLLVAGGYFLARNLGISLGFPFFDFNWWALFIVIPGAIILNNVHRAYQSVGGLTEHTRSQMVVGGAMVVFGTFWLFGLSGHLMVPFALIGVGLLLLVRHFTRQEEVQL